MYKKKSILLLLPIIAACSTTPNLTGWAEQTSTLRTTIEQENSIVVKRIDHVITEAKLAAEENWDMEGAGDPEELVKDWKKHRKAYLQSAGEMNATWQAISQYADAIASLAAAGETGRAASESLLASTTQIMNIAAPGIGFAVGSTFEALFGEIAEIVTRMQAQKTLALTMDLLDPEIRKLTGLSIDIATDFGSGEGIPSTIWTDERSLITAGYGPSRMHWYETNKGWSKNESLYRDLNEGTATVEEVAARAILLDALSEQFRARERARDKADSWFQTRANTQERIINAITVWQQEHHNVYAFLEKCGGSRSLRVECGNYNLENLKHAVAIINTAFPPNSDDN
jgi:hypothetical protein